MLHPLEQMLSYWFRKPFPTCSSQYLTVSATSAHTLVHHLTSPLSLVINHENKGLRRFFRGNIWRVSKIFLTLPRRFGVSLSCNNGNLDNFPTTNYITGRGAHARMTVPTRHAVYPWTIHHLAWTLLTKRCYPSPAPNTGPPSQQSTHAFPSIM